MVFIGFMSLTHVSIMLIDTRHVQCIAHFTTFAMAEERDYGFHGEVYSYCMRKPWWQNYLSFLEWNPEWHDEHGDPHHPDDAFHVHEIVVEKVETENVFKDPDTIVHPKT